MPDPERPKTFTYKVRFGHGPSPYDPDWLVLSWEYARHNGVPLNACWHTEESHPFPGISERIMLATWTAFA